MTVKVHLADSMGRTVDGAIMDRAEWPAWTAKYVDQNDGCARGVVEIPGHGVYVVKAIIDRNSIEWHGVAGGSR